MGPIRHWRGMLGDEKWLVLVTRGSEAEPEKPRALVIISVLDSFEPQLILKEVLEVSGKTSGGQRLAPGVIDPRAVIRIEPGVLMFVVITAVDLVGSPDIDHRRGVP